MIIDSDVLIWYLRGNAKAQKLVESSEGFTISAVTQMELTQGVRDKHEMRDIRRFIRDWKIEIVLIDESICNRALFYMEEYFLNHSLRMADALIAATAVVSSHTLVTGNSKHYRMIKDLSIQKFTC